LIVSFIIGKPLVAGMKIVAPLARVQSRDPAVSASQSRIRAVIACSLIAAGVSSLSSVSLFDWGPFLRPDLKSSWRRAQPRSGMILVANSGAAGAQH
jgi:hypothetical protein